MKRMYMQGRPPWYDATGSMKKPFIIGVSGGTASGKTTVCKKIIDSLQIRWVVLLSMDSFYKGLNEEQLKTVSEYNFDHPDAFDVEAIASTLSQLKEGKSVDIPTYDFKTHTRSSETKTTYGADVIIFEGILAFYFEELRNLMDMKIFVDEDPDIRLARRLKRDIAERGRDLEGVLNQYDKFVKPSFENYIYPTKKYADIIIPRGPSNTVAIKLITEHIKTKLKAGGFQFQDMINQAPTLAQLPPNVKVMKKTTIIHSIHTTIRNRDTPRSEFIYHSHRLSRLLFEEALNHLPYEEKVVTTPTGAKYVGRKMQGELCGVSIMRAGESMETALREVCGGVPILKILIQSENKHPKLFYCKMCSDLPQRTVLLMDPMLATGATVMMAIRVLIDHGVPEDKIYFLNLISSLQGISVVSYTFPKVKIITTEVDQTLNEKFYIDPGIGNFGDRYFGTESEGADRT